MTTFTDSVLIDAGSVTANAPALCVKQTWNGPDAGFAFTGIYSDFTDLKSHAISTRVIDLRVNGKSAFYAEKRGGMFVSNASGSTVGGIAVRGNAGEMALTSQHLDIIQYYWEGTAGQSAVIKGMGAHRLSIESGAAMVHIAANSHFEFEGYGSLTINFVGYEAGSSRGRSINFTNKGQTAEQATPLVVTNDQASVGNITEFRDGLGSLPVTVAAVQSDGVFMAQGLVLHNLPDVDPLVLHQVWNDAGTLRISAGALDG